MIWRGFLKIFRKNEGFLKENEGIDLSLCLRHLPLQKERET
jgi:hypothetical protein